MTANFYEIQILIFFLPEELFKFNEMYDFQVLLVVNKIMSTAYDILIHVSRQIMYAKKENIISFKTFPHIFISSHIQL